MRKHLILLGLVFCNIYMVIASSKDTVEISFQSKGYTLKGKLIVPKEKETKIPAIIFLIGSGGNSSYATDYKKFIDFFLETPLENENVALLYFDKRGVGQSEGKWYNIDFEQRALDAKNAAEYLRTIPEIDPDKIYVVGHSQGGWIVQICLAEYPDLFAGGVSMAGPTFSVKRQLINDYQSSFICNKGMSPVKAYKKAKNRVNRDLTIVSLFPFQENWKQLKVIKKFDPKNHLLSIRKPILLLFAENDRLVNPDWSLQEFKNLFPNGGPQVFTNYVAKGENHNFQTSPLCYKGEWSDLKFSEKTRDVMVDWLIQEFNSGNLY
ncbi:hypothetical protein BH23BAC1_BH23BAC1_43490 [soil metagenome]